MLSAAENARYNRHLLLPEFGAAGQERLKSARVLIVGAGGLGSPAGLYLAAAGIGTLGLIDHDHVELSNLQRQVLFTTAEIGAPKAAVAQRRLLALNPQISVHAHEFKLRAANAAQVLANYDLVVDGSDRLATRYLVNDACVLLGKPLVSAAIHRFEGQASSYAPGRAPCYRCLFPEVAEQVVANCAEAGVLGVLPGVMGSLQALEAIKILAGIGAPLFGRLLTFDALAMSWQEFQFTRRDDCPVCGVRPSIHSLLERPGADLDNSSSLIEALQPRELLARQQRAASDGAAITLVDVRQPREFAPGHLASARNIPLADLERRLAEIPLQFPVVFICRSGTRSLAAAQLAERAGLGSIAHLAGGMLAWAAELEPAMTIAPPD